MIILDNETTAPLCPQKRSREKWDLLSGFDEGVGRHDHEDAIGEDGQNDEEGEERMNKDVDGHTPDGIERRQEPHGVRRAEPENIFAFADHHERLPRPKSKHTHTPNNTQASDTRSHTQHKGNERHTHERRRRRRRIAQ